MVDLTVKRQRHQRSAPQNRYYWGVVIMVSAECYGYQLEEMHDAWKWRFLRLEDPDHKTTAEFERYLEQIRFAALEDFGVVIPLPNEVEAASEAA